MGLLCSFVNGIVENSIFDPPISAPFGSAMITVLFKLERIRAKTVEIGVSV